MNEQITYQQAMVLVDQAYRFQMRGQLGDAIELYEKSLSIHPTAKAHTFLGWAYSMMKRYDEAIEQCEKAIIVDPDYGNPYNDIGAYLIELGKPNEAMLWLEQAIETTHYETPWFAIFNIGRIHLMRGDYMAALSHFDEALALDPLYQPARTAKASLLSRLC